LLDFWSASTTPVSHGCRASAAPRNPTSYARNCVAHTRTRGRRRPPASAMLVLLPYQPLSVQKVRPCRSAQRRGAAHRSDVISPGVTHTVTRTKLACFFLTSSTS
jgi:hypothetical protein